jgi:Uma2 family endonuclease
MSAVLEPLLQSPKLPSYVAELNQLLASERAARQRFRDSLTDSKKGEFINGQIIMHSPARFGHTDVCKLLILLLSAHVTRHRLGWIGFEKVLVGLSRNDSEPDVVFYGPEKTAALERNQLVFPPPDFIVEVLSETTESRDRGIKMEDYAAHGVREYWLVDPVHEFVEQYDLQGERYALRAKLLDGTLRSTVITGFSVPVRAAFDQELNVQVLSQITAAPTKASAG